ncbi:DNA polymerase Y family protein [Terriglobus aquaticus]|uniref:DNA polymerase Y family protein n=1 Tax=Terriglobus aquaticus TaxID=940139 RepID=A0ABW9KFY4_9BACT|nr:DNA polymerase Y family protein [Terriglobus aquaticus]
MSPIHQPRFLCVHVPEFPAQARLRHRPALRGKAIAILDGTPPLETVCSTTRLARQKGVRQGTTRAELDSFPGVEALRRSRSEEDSAAAALLAAVWQVSPRVQVLAPRNAAHRVVVDIAGTERIFGPPAQVARNVLQQVRALGLLAHLCVSDNFHTAVCAAPYAGGKPAVVAHGAERATLAPLPLSALDGVEEEQRDTFALWGLHTLGDLAALPETQLVARMGQAGRRLWLQARGEHPHLMQPAEDRFTLEERTEFDAPVDLLDSLLFVLRPMLEQLVLRANQRALALASVTVRLSLTNHAAEDTAIAPEATQFERTVKPALPLADSRILLKLLHLDLQAHPPGAPIVAVHLHAEPGDQTRAQLGMFSPQLPEPSRLDVTLARIRALVGEGRVGRPKLLDTHAPESYVVDTFAPHLRASGSASKTHSIYHPALHGDPLNYQEQASSFASQSRSLALRRLRPPVLLKMHTAEKQPKLFFWRGTRYEVATAFGPWRRSGNWWTTSAWSQEEWDVTANSSSGDTLVCRIARDIMHRHWLLEGIYD